MIKLCFSEADLPEGLALAARVRGVTLCQSGIHVNTKKIEKGLSVCGADGVYTIGYSEKALFFRFSHHHTESRQKSDIEVGFRASVFLPVNQKLHPLHD